jgi:hypothetical protein
MSFTIANIEHESPDDFLSSRRMGDFWMKLNPVERLRVVSYSCEGCCVCSAYNVEARRKFQELISMRHPHLHTFSESFEQTVDGAIAIANLGHLDLGKPVLPMVALRNLGLEIPCHFLENHASELNS